MLHRVLGCQWGIALWTEDDSDACKNHATETVVVHRPDEPNVIVKLCEKHHARILLETDPHGDFNIYNDSE